MILVCACACVCLCLCERASACLCLSLSLWQCLRVGVYARTSKHTYVLVHAHMFMQEITVVSHDIHTHTHTWRTHQRVFRKLIHIQKSIFIFRKAYSYSEKHIHIQKERTHCVFRKLIQSKSHTTAKNTEIITKYHAAKTHTHTQTNTPNRNSAYAESLQVTRYHEGQYYELHYDFSQPNRAQVDPEKYPYGDVERSITIIAYLSEGFSGGETVFPRVPAPGTPGRNLLKRVRYICALICAHVCVCNTCVCNI